MGPILEGDQTLQKYGNLRDSPKIIVHVWVGNIMTPVKLRKVLRFNIQSKRISLYQSSRSVCPFYA